MIKQFQYDCVNCPDVDELNHIIDNSTDITYNTFKEHVDMKYVRAFNNAVGIPINKDWCVSFHKSKTQNGKIVYFFQHSAIEHVFY